MAGLLSNAEEQEIRDAVKLVTDTFMRTPVTYQKFVGSIDRFQEGNGGKYTEYALLVLTEFDKTKIKEMQEGATQDFDVMLTINMDDLQTLNLVSAPNWKVPFNATKDYFMLKGERYKVDHVGYDGPLSSKECLVVIGGNKDIKPT